MYTKFEVAGAVLGMKQVRRADGRLTSVDLTVQYKSEQQSPVSVLVECAMEVSLLPSAFEKAAAWLHVGATVVLTGSMVSVRGPSGAATPRLLATHAAQLPGQLEVLDALESGLATDETSLAIARDTLARAASGTHGNA